MVATTAILGVGTNLDHGPNVSARQVRTYRTNHYRKSPRRIRRIHKNKRNYKSYARFSRTQLRFWAKTDGTSVKKFLKAQAELSPSNGKLVKPHKFGGQVYLLTNQRFHQLSREFHYAFKKKRLIKERYKRIKRNSKIHKISYCRRNDRTY